MPAGLFMTDILHSYKLLLTATNWFYHVEILDNIMAGNSLNIFCNLPGSPFYLHFIISPVSDHKLLITKICITLNFDRKN